jgi:hypothetical protein
MHIDLIILKVRRNPVQLYLIMPKVWVDPRLKDIFTLKVSLDLGCRMHGFKYLYKSYFSYLISPKVSTDSGRLKDFVTPEVS